jgi:uncharacterized protein (TIGR02453 family)
MQTILHFLNELKDNNNREWFNENKKLFESAKGEFEMLLNQIIPGIQTFDDEIGSITAKDCMFRIYRDIRFSKDKTPYKTNFGGFISKGGRKSGYAGYYLHIEPNKSFLAGGSYMPPNDLLKKMRQEIFYNVDEFKRIINSKEFRKSFGSLEGEKLVRPPKDFPADFEDIDLLKHKSYVVLHPVEDKRLLTKNFIDDILEVYQHLKPLNHFLNRALG